MPVFPKREFNSVGSFSFWHSRTDKLGFAQVTCPNILLAAFLTAAPYLPTAAHLISKPRVAGFGGD